MVNQANKPIVTSEDLDDSATSSSLQQPNPVEEKTKPKQSSKTESVTASSETPEANSGSAKKILVVEDEKPLSKALQAKLNNSGFTAEIALSGKEALEALEKGSYDLVLTDLLMPTMDGWDLLAKLKEMKSAPTVVVLSNLGQSEDLEKAKELGAKDFWIKADLSLSEIVERVTDLLG